MPTINKLTDSQCRSFKSTDKPQKIFDGGGLYMFISPTGAKTWRLAYRIEGKAKTISFGPYPAVSLSEARQKRDLAKSSLRNGVDPMVVKRPTANKQITLSNASQKYWSDRKDVSDSYRTNALNAINRYLNPRLGHRPINEITRDDLLLCLNAINAAGRFVYVRKVKAWVAQVFDWAKEQGYVDENPTGSINSEKAFGKSRVRHRAALEARDIPEFLSRLSIEKDLNSVIACKLLALTWVRTKELRTMTWDQLEGDMWRLPASHMKSDEYHLVPLSRQALALLNLMRERSRGSRYVFPNESEIDKCMSENSILYLIYRIGFKNRMTGHGWRTVGSTWANERGYNVDAIERQLAHAPEDQTRAAYNRASYLVERREMLQDWADWLDSCYPDAGTV